MGDIEGGGVGGLGYVPCFKDFDVCFIFVGGGVGGTSGEERCRELLEVGGYLWYGGFVGEY